MSINSITNTITGKSGQVNDNQHANKTNNVLNPNTSAQRNTGVATSIDTVNITGAASQLQALEKQISNLPVVDIQRVDAIKRKIANGTFEISAPQIAEKMIQLETTINNKLV